jgi:acyl carrier protein
MGDAMQELEPYDTPPASRAEIETWLRRVVGELLHTSPEEVSVEARLSRLGLDSTTALIVTDMLSEWLRTDLEPTLLYEHPTIAALSTHLAGIAEKQREVGDPR